MHPDMPTPYEQGNQNQTTTWSDCIAFYEELAQRFPHVLRFEQIGTSDGGIPVHAGVISADGVHDRAQIKAERDARRDLAARKELRGLDVIEEDALPVAEVQELPLDEDGQP